MTHLDRGLLALVQRVATQTAQRVVDAAPRVRYVPATLGTYDAATGAATVTLDGDAAPTQAHAIAPGLAAGSRVMCALSPPSLTLVVGTIGPPASEGPWFPWTPEWTAVTGTITQGNATRSGRYRLDGKTLTASFEIVVGSTSVYAGTSLWRVGLPEGLAGKTGSYRQGILLLADDTGVAASAPQHGLVDPAAAFVQTFLGATSPFTFGTGDRFYGAMTIEVD